MVVTHDLRIKNNMDEILQMKLKYDRIISDNLYVSGFIGPTCQFKNLSEYLFYNISEFSKVILIQLLIIPFLYFFQLMY